MTSVRTVLVVGGGTAGCALATLLGRAGVAVEIVERKPDFTTYGSGITLQGAALRVLREVGVWEELRRYGFEFNSLGLRSADGRLLAEIPDARTGMPTASTSCSQAATPAATTCSSAPMACARRSGGNSGSTSRRSRSAWASGGSMRGDRPASSAPT